MVFSRPLLYYIFIPSLASVIIAAPANDRLSSSSTVSFREHRARRARYLGVRDDLPSIMPFWPFQGTPPPDGLSPMSVVLMEVLDGPTDATSFPTPTASSPDSLTSAPTQSIPDDWLPRTPIITSTALSSQRTMASTAGSNPDPNEKTHPHTSGHEIAFMAAIIGCIGGIGLAVAICRSLAASKVCGWGSGRKKQTGVLAASLDSALEFKHNKTTSSLDDISHEDVLDIKMKRSSGDNLLASPANSRISGRAPQLASTPILWSRSSIPPYNITPIIPPSDFFRKIDEEERVARDSVRSSRTRSSYASSIVSRHCRAKSAPILSFLRPQSVKSGKSTAESEWDIAHAYGAPRFDKTKSAGAMSGLSVESREWD